MAQSNRRALSNTPLKPGSVAPTPHVIRILDLLDKINNVHRAATALRCVAEHLVDTKELFADAELDNAEHGSPRNAARLRNRHGEFEEARVNAFKLLNESPLDEQHFNDLAIVYVEARSEFESLVVKAEGASRDEASSSASLSPSGE